MNFRRTGEFEKDLKRLRKKYRSLLDDLREFMNVVAVQPLGFGKHFAVITKGNGVIILKARLFCRSLKGASLRVIYAYRESGCHSEFVGVEFIELYFKGDKENEDRERIQTYLNSLGK